MVQKVLRSLIGKLKAFLYVPRIVQKLIRQFRGLKRSIANYIRQITPGTARKSRPSSSVLVKRYNRQQQFLQQNRIRRTTTTQEERRVELKRSNTTRALAILFSVSAITTLAALVISQVNKYIETIYIDKEVESIDTLLGKLIFYAISVSSARYKELFRRSLLKDYRLIYYRYRQLKDLSY